MLIRICYKDRKYDMVKPWLLDRLIRTRRLFSFERSTRWVLVGQDNIRGAGGMYQGPERRKRLSL